MRPRVVMLVLTTVLLGLACGCSTSTAGSPTPVGPTASSPSPSSASDLPKYGAPKVEHPLDVSSWETRPCDTIPAAALQAAGFGGASTNASVGLAGPGCEWSAPNYGGAARILFDTAPRYREGLSAFYGGRDEDKLFMSLTVQGYPAVISDAQDNRATGQCDVIVGVSDQLTFDASVSLGVLTPSYTNPCSSAQTMANAAMTTMLSGH